MRTERVIEISAPPERVWSIVADVERWHEWTPSITSIQPVDAPGLSVGSRFRVVQPKFPPAVWRVTSLEPGRSFDWIVRSPGVFVTGSHVVEPHGAGSIARLSVDQKGLLGRLIGMLTADLTRRYVEMEAQGLKRRSETG